VQADLDAERRAKVIQQRLDRLDEAFLFAGSRLRAEMKVCWT
jgi:hypothetical protein